MNKNFCIFNGELVKISELNNAPVFAINESTQEDIRLYNTKPLCLGRHVQQIEERLLAKEIPIPEKFTVGNLDRYIHRLLNVNKVYKGGICTLLVFQKTFPEKSESQFCIFISPLPELEYSFNKKGIALDFADEDKEFISYTPNSLFIENENLTTTCKFYKSGHLFSTDLGDILIIKNEEIHVVERLLPLTSYFIDYLARKNWDIKRHPYLTKKLICESSEILLCSSFIGVHWVRRVTNNSNAEGLSYGYKHAKQLFEELNDLLNEL